VGLLGARKIRYFKTVKTYPYEEISNHPRKGGGLWVVKRLSDARQIIKYLKRKHNIVGKIFECDIGSILYETPYRVKTCWVKLDKEVA